ncbi:MAG: CAP domain-containing protein [Nocardioidaceae bacterium]|nr:CAP domain-containing protein [Nocardioidaceae bacterium]
MRENKKRFGLGFAGLAMMTAAVVGLVAEATPAEAGMARGTRVTARWTGAIQTSSMAAVNSAYWSQYANKQRLPIDWLGGSIAGCVPGLASLFSNNATLSSLNYVRSLAGLAPVTFSPTLNYQAQRAALMMDANDRLDHHPTSGWRCYSSTGAAAASKSNLALAWPSLKSGQVIDLYMDDRGSSNTAVGHRRWVLNPFATVMGSGSTDSANALMVIGPSSAYRPNPRYVSWPTPGYFPNTMEPGSRWSLSAGLSRTDFRRARVAVWQNGVRLSVHRYRPHSGYAQPTLVWQMPATISKTAAFKVVVSNIHRKGSRKAFRYAYTVRLFTPYQ